MITTLTIMISNLYLRTKCYCDAPLKCDDCGLLDCNTTGLVGGCQRFAGTCCFHLQG